tara:strand:+ start:1581 stop:1754 length:174 start_codon:yes stop_codon:yes gene_type:complete
MKHLVKKVREKMTLTLREVRSRRDRRKQEKSHRNICAQQAANEAIFEMRTAKNWQPE